MSSEPPDLVDVDEVQRQLNLLERVKGALGTDDDFLAAMLANQVQLARVEQVENDLLRDIRDGLIQVDIGEVTIGETVLESAFKEGLTARQVSFPETGGRFSFPAAATRQERITFNLETGKLDIPDVGDRVMSTSLDQLGAARARSLFIWADQDLDVFAFDEDDTQTGVWQHDQCGFTSLQGLGLARFELEAAAPFNFRMAASISPLAPIQTFPVANHQERFGHITTSAQDFTTDTAASSVLFAGINAADYGVADLPTAADTYGNATLHTEAIGQHVFIVTEVGNNADAEVQLREWNVDGEQKVADNDFMAGNTSIANTNTQTVTQDDFAVFETDINTRFKQLLCQSADGSEVELRVQYHGLSSSVR